MKVCQSLILHSDSGLYFDKRGRNTFLGKRAPSNDYEFEDSAYDKWYDSEDTRRFPIDSLMRKSGDDKRMLRNNFLGKRVIRSVGSDPLEASSNEKIKEMVKLFVDELAAEILSEKQGHANVTVSNDQTTSVDAVEDDYPDVQDALLMDRDERAKNTFLGKRAKNTFLGKRAKNTFLGKRAKNTFLGKRAKNTFLGKREERSRNTFLGKRAKNTFLGKRDA